MLRSLAASLAALISSAVLLVAGFVDLTDVSTGLVARLIGLTTLAPLKPSGGRTRLATFVESTGDSGRCSASSACLFLVTKPFVFADFVVVVYSFFF